jgi:hypothetical protein
MVRLTPPSAPLLRLVAAGALVVLLSSAASAQKTNPIKVLKGVVTDATSGKPIDGGRLYVYSRTATDPVAQSRINPSTGAFQVVLGPATEYRFVVISPRFLAGETVVRTPDGNNYQEVPQNLSVQPIPVGKTLYRGRAFDANAADLKTSTELDKAIRFMKESQAATLTVTILPEGSTKAAKAAPKSKKGKKGKASAENSQSGTSTVTTASVTSGPAPSLSQSRLQAIKSLMQREGISLTRMTWKTPATAAEAGGLAKGKDNLVIVITGVDVEEVEED